MTDTVDGGAAGKRALAGLLRTRAFNVPMRLALRPFARMLPIDWLRRLPLVGTTRATLRPGVSFTLESDGRDLIASAIDWCGFAGWEPETFAVLRRLLPTVSTCFDVGASTGVFSLTVATDDPARRVYAFEATPGMMERLRRNLELNGTRNVTPVEGAVCEREGTIDLFIPPGVSLPFGASTLESFRAPGRRLAVRAVQLDAFARAHAIPRVDLVKIDTEGTEPKVLEGARELLARDEPWIVCEVLQGMTEEGLHRVLDPLGYRYWSIGARGLESRERIAGDPTYRDRNWLFATPRRFATLASA